jgi:uncharacterized membrane protein AbrB (regulator of aidB expression)
MFNLARSLLIAWAVLSAGAYIALNESILNPLLAGNISANWMLEALIPLSLIGCWIALCFRSPATAVMAAIVLGTSLVVRKDWGMEGNEYLALPGVLRYTWSLMMALTMMGSAFNNSDWIPDLKWLRFFFITPTVWCVIVGLYLVASFWGTYWPTVNFGVSIAVFGAWASATNFRALAKATLPHAAEAPSPEGAKF